MPTKTSQSAYKKNMVGKKDQQKIFVPLLYQFCRQDNHHTVSELRRNAYKTTKISYFLPAFSSLTVKAEA